MFSVLDVKDENLWHSLANDRDEMKSVCGAASPDSFAS